MQGSLTRKYFGIALLLSLLICITIHFPLLLGALFGDEAVRGGDAGTGGKYSTMGLQHLSFSTHSW